jgi:uncharacterized protein
MSAARRSARRRAGLALPLFVLGLAATVLAAAPDTQGLQPVPKLAARVTDLTGTLTAEQQTALEQKLAAFEAAKGSQLAVLMVPTTQPEDIFQYSFRVADQWKLGRGTVGGQRVDDGALLIVAKNDRHVWIQVGYGLEGVLTDAMCRRIVDETITPEFRQGNFYGGIDAGLDRMMRLVQGEALPPPEQGWQSGHATGRHGSGALPGLLFAVLIGSVVLRGIFGRTLGSVFTAAGAAALAWVAGLALVVVVLAAVAGFLFSMLGGLARGSGWSSGLGGGWGGLGGGGFGGGFGGGGGFSGGGGGFGGGGAGGSW